MREKLIAALKNKYKDLGFGPKAIEQVADFLLPNVTDEANIDTAVSGVEGLLKVFTGEADRRSATLQAELDKLKKPDGGTPPTSPTSPEKTGDPKIDLLMETIRELNGKVTGLIEKDKTTTLQSRWETAAKSKGITNPKLIEKWMPKSEEEFEGALTDVTAFNTEFQKQTSNERSPGRPPAASGAAGSKAANEALKVWAAQKKPAPATEQEQKA